MLDIIFVCIYLFSLLFDILLNDIKDLRDRARGSSLDIDTSIYVYPVNNCRYLLISLELKLNYS